MHIIHKGRYIAEYDPVHLILVITRPKGNRRFLQGTQAIDWANAIQTALDKSEANALCYAIINALE